MVKSRAGRRRGRMRQLSTSTGQSGGSWMLMMVQLGMGRELERSSRRRRKQQGMAVGQEMTMMKTFRRESSRMGSRKRSSRGWGVTPSVKMKTGESSNVVSLMPCWCQSTDGTPRRVCYRVDAMGLG
jgi:hypothetical protein